MNKVVWLAVMLAATTAAADQKAAKKPAAPAAASDHDAMMAEYMKLATPGEQHKWLQDSVGTWTATGKMYFDPSKPPTESTGTAVFKSVLGGRFVEEHFTGTMMGQPFEGQGVTGYDNMKKKFVMSWVDSMGTMMIYVEGTGDAKQRTFAGEETGPDGKKRAFRWVLKFDSKDKHVMEMYGTGPDGKEVKQMEIVYTRKS